MQTGILVIVTLPVSHPSGCPLCPCAGLGCCLGARSMCCRVRGLLSPQTLLLQPLARDQGSSPCAWVRPRERFPWEGPGRISPAIPTPRCGGLQSLLEPSLLEQVGAGLQQACPSSGSLSCGGRAEDSTSIAVFSLNLYSRKTKRSVPAKLCRLSGQAGAWRGTPASPRLAGSLPAACTPVTHRSSTELPRAPSDALQRPDSRLSHSLNGETSRRIGFPWTCQKLFKMESGPRAALARSCSARRGACPGLQRVLRWSFRLAAKASRTPFPDEVSPVSAGMHGALSTPGPRQGERRRLLRARGRLRGAGAPRGFSSFPRWVSCREPQCQSCLLTQEGTGSP